MGRIVIDPEKCMGCSVCVKSCTAGALSMKESDEAKNRLHRIAVLDDGLCTLCSSCISGCRFGAIRMETEKAAVTDYHGVMVFAEQTESGFLPVAFELLGKGRELSDDLHVKLMAVYFTGKASDGDIKDEAAALIKAGADKVFAVKENKKAEKLEESYAERICAIVEREKPEILLTGATMFGRSLAPRIAACLRTGLTADCTVLSIDKETGLLQQTRPAFGGNLMATIICPKNRPQMATVRPGIMAAAVTDESRTGEVVIEDKEASAVAGIEIIEAVKAAKTESIKDARIIIDCGRGIGSKKNLKLVKELCEKLGAAYGCSRPLVDTGMCEYPHQVGQTGCTVAPDLLITLGVSGAIQHLAGISNAKRIIAVNTDPDAPIFTAAHVKIVADCMDVVKEIMANI